jgi:hypothetical protein
MNDELKATCLYFIVHTSLFFLSSPVYTWRPACPLQFTPAIRRSRPSMREFAAKRVACVFWSHGTPVAIDVGAGRKAG